MIFTKNRAGITSEKEIKTAYIKQIELTGRFLESEPRRPSAEKFDK